VTRLVYGPDGGVVAVTDRPFRRIKGDGICALDFCGEPVDTFHDSELCFYHRQVALGLLAPWIETQYSRPEVKKILANERRRYEIVPAPGPR